MKKIITLFLITIFHVSFSQEVLKDHWQSVYAFYYNSSYLQYKKSIVVNDQIISVTDTFSGGNYGLSALNTFDINTRAVGAINFTLAPGDRGITCATSYKTSTPGLEYGIFGCFSDSDTGPSYPVIYTYNSQTGLVTADSIHQGTVNMYNGGIQQVYMFSPTTNNDTIRAFTKYNSGISVFSKHISQSSFTLNNFVSINIDYVNACFVHNNKLYIGGMYSDLPCLLESTDGRTFTPVASFNPNSFPQYSCVNEIISFNNQLYYTVNLSPNNYQIFRYDNVTHTELINSISSELSKNFAVYKNKLWFPTYKNDALSVIANIYNIDVNDNIDTSGIQIGYQDIDGYYTYLVTNTDSLYFLSVKGTFAPSKPASQASTKNKQLDNQYINYQILMPPVSSFNYNNNQVCLNANETYSSTSQNADSLHWLYDGAYYASSPGGSAWMNINFPTIGNHVVGLVAFGGTLTDTSFLSVSVYEINVSIAVTQTVVCFNSNVSGSAVFTQTTTGTMGAVSYQWMRGLPNTQMSTASSYTYTAASFGQTYPFWLNVTDAHGCTAGSNIIQVRESQKYDVHGSLLTPTPSVSYVPGSVVLYKYETTLGKFDSITTVYTGSGVQYIFPSVDDGQYILKAIPDASTLQVSYYGNSAINWMEAIPITQTCGSPSSQNINVIPLVNIGTGPGELRGTITQTFGFGQKPSSILNVASPGAPIGGIIVKGGKNPGGMVAQTKTALDGTYTLTGLPISATDYFILVDIPGLDTNGTYHPYISANDPIINGLDFIVDSMYINPKIIVTSVVYDKNILNNTIQVYPNPAAGSVNIKYELISQSFVQADLYDILGNKVKQLIEYSENQKNKYNHNFNLSDLSSGIYFVKIKFNYSENTIKLILNN